MPLTKKEIMKGKMAYWFWSCIQMLLKNYR